MNKKAQENPFLPNPNAVIELIKNQAMQSYETVKEPVFVKKRETRKKPVLGKVKGAKRND